MRHSLEEGPTGLPRSENINNLHKYSTLQFLGTFMLLGPCKNLGGRQASSSTHNSTVKTRDPKIIQL